MMLATTVLVADDHPLFRDGLSRAVLAHPDLQLVAAVGDGRAALTAVRRFEPRVAVLDIEMPLISGLQILRSVTADGLATAVLLVSSHVEGATIHDAIAAGAAGFLAKDIGPTEIGKAVAAVGRGEVVLSPTAASNLAREVRHGAPARQELSLSERELDVLGMIADGRSAPEIARELELAPTTVKSHLRSLYAKLGVSDRAAAVAVAMRRGLLR
jgi:two-component system nitrate/nitrite response regulator NarL